VNFFGVLTPPPPSGGILPAASTTTGRCETHTPPRSNVFPALRGPWGSAQLRRLVCHPPITMRGGLLAASTTGRHVALSLPFGGLYLHINYFIIVIVK